MFGIYVHELDFVVGHLFAILSFEDESDGVSIVSSLHCNGVVVSGASQNLSHAVNAYVMLPECNNGRKRVFFIIHNL